MWEAVANHQEELIQVCYLVLVLPVPQGDMAELRPTCQALRPKMAQQLRTPPFLTALFVFNRRSGYVNVWHI